MAVIRYHGAAAMTGISEKHYTVSATGTANLDACEAWLVKHFGVTILPSSRYMEADFLLCDSFNFKHEKYRGVKIMITGENHHIDLNEYDYCLSHDIVENDRCHRLPFWIHNPLLNQKRRKKNLLLNRPTLTREDLEQQQRKFAIFICRNAACRVRNRFVKRLSAARHVDCGGPFMNNLGYNVDDKIAFQRDYLFSVAYENEAYPGYQTEKIIDAYASRCIPIYWGNPLVTEEFNPESFVNARDFRNDRELIDYLLKLADDPDRQLAMLNAPIFRDPQVFEHAEEELLSFFTRIFERGPGAIQRTRKQRIMAVLRRYYGHGLFRTLRRFTRWLRGKKINQYD